MKATGSKILFLVPTLIISLRTATGIMERQCSDSLKAWADCSSEIKVPTKENSSKVYFVVKGASTTSMAPGMKETGKTPK